VHAQAFVRAPKPAFLYFPGPAFREGFIKLGCMDIQEESAPRPHRVLIGIIFTQAYNLAQQTGRGQGRGAGLMDLQTKQSTKCREAALEG